MAGADGYQALLRRSLALARAEVPALQGVTEKADGSMHGLEEVAAGASNSGGDDPAIAIIAHLLELLVVSSANPSRRACAWPDAALGE